MRAALTRPVVGLKLADRLRVCVLVQIDRNGAGAVAAFEIVTRRSARAQWMATCGCAVVFEKTASDPSAVAAYDQLPAIGTAVLKSGIGGGATGAGAGLGVGVWAWSEEAAVSASAAAMRYLIRA